MAGAGGSPAWKGTQGSRLASYQGTGPPGQTTRQGHRSQRRDLGFDGSCPPTTLQTPTGTVVARDSA